MNFFQCRYCQFLLDFHFKRLEMFERKTKAMHSLVHALVLALKNFPPPLSLFPLLSLSLSLSFFVFPFTRSLFHSIDFPPLPVSIFPNAFKSLHEFPHNLYLERQTKKSDSSMGIFGINRD